MCPLKSAPAITITESAQQPAGATNPRPSPSNPRKLPANRPEIGQGPSALEKNLYPRPLELNLVTTQRFRIVEWTSEFKDGSRKVTYELLKQTERDSLQLLGTSDTLAAARKALLFYTPHDGCWSS